MGIMDATSSLKLDPNIGRLCQFKGRTYRIEAKWFARRGKDTAYVLTDGSDRKRVADANDVVLI